MITENNKVALDSISEGNPFPSGRIDMRLIEINWLLSKVDSTHFSPESLNELGRKIERMAKEIQVIIKEWKETA